jgi:hypothetical protein
MVWSKVEALCFACAAFADERIGHPTFKGFQSLAIIVGVDEVMELSFELVVAVIMKAFDRCHL